jgi:protease I
MAGRLDGKKVAILATDGFEQSELFEPRHALMQAGAEVTVVSLKPGEIQGMKHQDKGETIRVDKTLDQVSAGEFDALMLPGGVSNPDTLRMHPEAVSFAKAFFDAEKPVAAICHGPWLLAEADVLQGRTVTSWPSIRTDLRNAGAKVVDQEVVVDEGLVTSRKPADIPAFNAKMIEEFAEGRHAGAKRQPSQMDSEHLRTQ